ncbi:uncharacterized protein LOC119734950 [Patiria miniata]|uniref:Uncharacterized protein n=1 Tax=Patiria miniata TaxID=46514 RepID=A0A914AKK5_PATMI|nr:uncharacterized protein LOC119722184 [Patiria miniata]XP_038064525.1 uncharacterized protein LOC119734950 [Patiria miniata]
MTARPPRPVVEVKHRYLAWDKPQFLIANTSKRPETSPKTSLDSRNARTRRDVKLTVSRSADPHTVRRGPNAVDNRLGKSQQRLSSQLNNSASTSSTPVIIADLWKPMQIRYSTTQEKLDFVNNAHTRSHSQPALAFDNFNTRQEAQKLLQNSRSSVNQLLKNHRDRLSSSRYPVKSTEPSDTGYRNHRVGEIAGYQIFGGSLPRTSVYNVNERMVSSASDLSSLSFGSIDHEVTDNVTPTCPQRASESRTLIQYSPNIESQSALLKDRYFDVENGNNVVSAIVSSDHSRSNGVASPGNDKRTELTVNAGEKENTTKARSASSIRMPVDNWRRQHFVDNTVDSGPSEAVDALQPFRLNARLPSPDSRPVSSGVSPNFAEEISIVDQANRTEEGLPPDCSMCPMCRAQATLKAAETGEETREILEDLRKEGRDFVSFPRMDSNNSHFVSSESHQENHQQSVVENDKSPDQTLREQRKRTAERTGRSSIRLFNETSYNPPFPQNDKIDSYGSNEELIARKTHSDSETVKRNNVAEANMIDVDLKARYRSEKKANVRSPRRDFEPNIRNGAIVLRGRGLTRANRLEQTQYHTSPLHAAKWYMDAALPTRQASPRGSMTVSRGAAIPGLAPCSRYLPPAATPTMNHRVPLIIWRKLQQLDTPHHSDNRGMEYEYGSRLAGAAGYHGGGATRFTHQQPRVDPGDEKFASKSETLTSSLVIHIPTAGVTPEDVDCPPNSPE